MWSDCSHLFPIDMITIIYEYILYTILYGRNILKTDVPKNSITFRNTENSSTKKKGRLWVSISTPPLNYAFWFQYWGARQRGTIFCWKIFVWNEKMNILYSLFQINLRFNAVEFLSIASCWIVSCFLIV